MRDSIFIASLFIVFALIDGQGFDPEEDREVEIKIKAGYALAEDTLVAVYAMHEKCFQTAMPEKDFEIDNLQNFIIQPARTTLGLDDKFSTNRKYFGNMLQSTAFKEMVQKDVVTLRKEIVRKLKFCNESVMDPEVLKDFYDREVDQSKL